MRSALASDDPHFPNVLYYLPMFNRFADADWFIIHDLYVLFDTWQIGDWIRNGRDAIMMTKSGNEMMVYYLNYKEEEEICDYLGFQEAHGAKVDRTYY